MKKPKKVIEWDTFQLIKPPLKPLGKPDPQPAIKRERISMFKKFKEKVYLKIFEKFKDRSNPGAEMLAALTINAIRELNDFQKRRLALDVGLRINTEERITLIRQLVGSVRDDQINEALKNVIEHLSQPGTNRA